MGKHIIYQLFPRYFGNRSQQPKNNGDIKTNGCGKFADIDDKALESIKDLHITHLWLTGILEHATTTDYTEWGIIKDHPAVVKGKAGSPYAIKDYYDVDPDLAVNVPERMNEFEALVKRCHSHNMKVIIDFVPNHLARNYHSDAAPSGTRDFGIDDRKYHAFNPSNNFYYVINKPFSPSIDLFCGQDTAYTEFPAKVTGNDCFTESPGINDWYETVKLNYGVDYQGGGHKNFNPVPSTWFKMLDILMFWVDKGIDGFRCDMAEMVPVEFWEWAISRVKSKNEAVLFIAEVYNPNLYRDYIERGGFDYLYDKVGMYDTLRAVIEHKRPASDISGCWQSTNDFLPKMLYFLENHDEQRIASDFFASDPFKAIPGFMVAAFMNTNPIMLYNGQELGERGMDEEGFSGMDGRTTIFDYYSQSTQREWINNGKWDTENLNENSKKLRELYSKILELTVSEKALSEGSFFDLMYSNVNNPDFDTSQLFAFLRKYEHELLLVIVNFSKENKSIKLNIPKHAFDCLELSGYSSLNATELITNKTNTYSLNSTEPLLTDIKGYSGIVLKFRN